LSPTRRSDGMPYAKSAKGPQRETVAPSAPVA
jgi:hypothetical protein